MLEIYMYIYICRYFFQKYISQIIITSTRMLYHVNSYFLHASKLSDSCYKPFHGFFRL